MKQYNVGIHTSNGYRYASTQPSVKNPKTGRTECRHIHWGTLDDRNKFYPNKRFVTATDEERAQLVFPTDWDLSEIENTGFGPSVTPLTVRRSREMLRENAWDGSFQANRRGGYESGTKIIFNLIRKLEEEGMNSDKILEVVKAIEA